MRFDKAATTIDEQAALLEERGMTAEDWELVKTWLCTVGYYRLSAYWLPFEAPAPPSKTRSKSFRPKTRFEDIIRLYVFDRRLRLLILEATERIEVALRSRWTYHMANSHGPHAHMTPGHFVDGWKHTSMLAKLCNQVERSSEVFIEHYRSKYSEPHVPPLWAVSENMSFGEVSKWYQNTADNRLKTAIARELGAPTYSVLEGVLQVLSLVRNIAAHHSRLWNRRMTKALPRIKSFAADTHTVERSGSTEVDKRLYNVLVVAARLLLRQTPETSFVARVKELLADLNPAELEAMGFPSDWRTRPLWSDSG